MGAKTGLDFPLEESNNHLPFSRLSSRRRSLSTAESSFRQAYYGSGGGGAVPFRWETRPGTPKHPLSETPQRPLTPPPSYQLRGHGNQSGTGSKKSFKILSSLLPIKKIMATGSPTWSSSSSPSSYSYSLPSTPATNSTARSKTPAGDCDSWSSALCFRPTAGMKFFRKIF